MANIPKDPFESFEHSAFRLEGLPTYTVNSDREDFTHYKRTGEIRIAEPRWKEFVASKTANGATIQRLRLLSEQLTIYEKFELQRYSGPLGGEHIRTVLRRDYLSAYRYDFWLFDEKWLAQMVYTEDGTYVRQDIREATDDDMAMYRFWLKVYNGAALFVS